MLCLVTVVGFGVGSHVVCGVGSQLGFGFGSQLGVGVRSQLKSLVLGHS